MMSEAELLSPAGDFDTALSAFAAGADAVYCGLADFSARAFAKNFSREDLAKLVRYARANGKKVYVTFNTVLDEDAVEGAVETLADLEEIGPDALIVQDLGVARLVRKHFPGLAIHASTQLVAHNLEGVLAMKELGFSRVVLARELSLEEITSIAKRSGVELEAFIHGALCYSVSGLCLFSAMEKDRSGNRGKCAYCCRLPYETESGDKTLSFSMKDLRLGEDVRKLVAAGVVSLKIEGRMKSPLYVSTVTKYYRDILDSSSSHLLTPSSSHPLPLSPSHLLTPSPSLADLETVFSRRTTELYLNGRGAKGVIDPESLGHLGTPIGTVKRVTKDREGNAWLRFHTARALEKHDGLQFASPEGGKPVGFGITMMRQAISRAPVFEVAAGTDVEILLPPPDKERPLDIRSGATVYCSMSNKVKRDFPVPSFRPSDYPGTVKVDVEVTIAPDRIVANGHEIRGSFMAAKNPDKTADAVRKAFSKLGETGYALGKLTVNDPGKLFAPMSVLNDLRRDLVESLDEERAKAKRAKIERALADDETGSYSPSRAFRRVKLRPDEPLPPGTWDEIIVAINSSTPSDHVSCFMLHASCPCRLALPVYTAEPDFNRLRVAVKRFIREGFTAFEASDLATVRMLKGLGVEDITADWTCYAFNAHALAAWTEFGVKRFVASPENNRENLVFLAESGYDVEILSQQSTPLFISLHEPERKGGDLRDSNGREIAVFERDGMWITTKRAPRVFTVPAGASSRVDLSWDPPVAETINEVKA